MAAATSLQARALRYLAQREHSRAELRRKLLRTVQRAATGTAPDAATSGHATEAADAADAADVPDVADVADVPYVADVPDARNPATAGAVVDAVLDWLEAQRFLSNERFVESRINLRAARYGNLRIRQELAQHHAELTPDAAQQLKASEFDRAQAIWSRKFGAPDGSAPPGRSEAARQMRFLAGRGFSADVIRQVMRSVAGRAAGSFDEATPDAD